MSLENELETFFYGKAKPRTNKPIENTGYTPSSRKEVVEKKEETYIPPGFKFPRLPKT